MNCPQCNQELRDSAQFCDGCGRFLTLLDSAANPSRSNAEQPPEPDPWLGKIIGEKYQILNLLGQGGMGSVYRARRLHIGDEVAVKVLHREYVNETKTVERFRREAQAAAMLRHPAVVAIYDFGEGRGSEPAFIVMELIEGTSLRKILERDGALEATRAVALIREVCKGVAVAHRHNVIHRDIKPDNIMILPADVDDGSERVKVVDFGIAKLRDMAASKKLTQTGRVVGTVYYMSPEQCCAEDLDARSDVYSLGAVLYEMLAGAPLFNGETGTAIVVKHLNQAPPPFPPTLGIAPALEAVIMRALAKEPAARQADASVLRKELGPVGDAVSEAPDEATTAELQFKQTISTNRQVDTVLDVQAAAASTAIERSVVQPGSVEVKTPPKPSSRAPLVVALVALLLVVGGFILVRKLGTQQPGNPPATPAASLEHPASWQLVRTLGTDSKVYALAFFSGSDLLVSASSEGMRADREFVSEMKFWKLSSGELLRTVTEHSEGVLAISFSPDGKNLASATGSGSANGKIGKVKLWDARTGTLKWAVNGHTDYATTLAFDPEGKTIASGSLDHAVKLWDAQKGTLLKSFPQADSVWAIAFSPSGKLLAIAGQRQLELWNVDSGELQQSLSSDLHPRAVAFSPDGQLLASGDVSGAVSLWDVQSGALKKSLSEHTDVVDALAFSRDGTFLASGGYDAKVIIWEIRNGTKLRKLTDTDKVTAIAFSQDGHAFASGGWARSVKLWGE